MGYRPICDVWLLARSKVKYYGAYPAGFLSRARALLGVSIDDPVLHLCSGMVKDYPFGGYGANDLRVDMDPSTEPDAVRDIREPFNDDYMAEYRIKAVLADPPYTEADADYYPVGREALPSCGDIFNRAREVLRPGERLGILHYIWAKPPADFKNIAVVTVLVGFNNRARLYTVYERCA